MTHRIPILTTLFVLLVIPNVSYAIPVTFGFEGGTNLSIDGEAVHTSVVGTYSRRKSVRFNSNGALSC